MEDTLEHRVRIRARVTVTLNLCLQMIDSCLPGDLSGLGSSAGDLCPCYQYGDSCFLFWLTGSLLICQLACHQHLTSKPVPWSIFWLAVSANHISHWFAGGWHWFANSDANPDKLFTVGGWQRWRLRVINGDGLVSMDRYADAWYALSSDFSATSDDVSSFSWLNCIQCTK